MAQLYLLCFYIVLLLHRIRHRRSRRRNSIWRRQHFDSHPEELDRWILGFYHLCRRPNGRYHTTVKPERKSTFRFPLLRSCSMLEGSPLIGWHEKYCCRPSFWSVSTRGWCRVSSIHPLSATNSRSWHSRLRLSPWASKPESISVRPKLFIMQLLLIWNLILSRHHLIIHELKHIVLFRANSRHAIAHLGMFRLPRASIQWEPPLQTHPCILIDSVSFRLLDEGRVIVISR